jgi:hypothetical protein
VCRKGPVAARRGRSCELGVSPDHRVPWVVCSHGVVVECRPRTPCRCPRSSAGMTRGFRGQVEKGSDIQSVRGRVHERPARRLLRK